MAPLGHCLEPLDGVLVSIHAEVLGVALVEFSLSPASIISSSAYCAIDGPSDRLTFSDAASAFSSPATLVGFAIIVMAIGALIDDGDRQG